LIYTNRKYHEAQIIYATTEPQFALQAYAAIPINYIIKPIDKQQLFDTLAHSEDVDKERVKNALERVGLNGLLDKMPKGINTYVYMDFDKEGVEISGGEAQKMEIARAIYQDRPFVIMDEPTAALDPIAEYEVYAGFNELVGNKTAIYISHRLSSCRFCNDIIVFEDGKVVQRGNHTSLVKRKGLYAKMWNAQAQYYADTKNAVAFQE